MNIPFYIFCHVSETVSVHSKKKKNKSQFIVVSHKPLKKSRALPSPSTCFCVEYVLFWVFYVNEVEKIKVEV